MKGYKKQLRSKLEDGGWELVELVSSDEWWSDECWKMRLRGEPNGADLFITFIVDPQWQSAQDGDRPVVSRVLATMNFPPDDWNTRNYVTELDMGKGDFAAKLDSFISDVEAKCAVYRGPSQTRLEHLARYFVQYFEAVADREDATSLEYWLELSPSAGRFLHLAINSPQDLAAFRELLDELQSREEGTAWTQMGRYVSEWVDYLGSTGERD